MGHTLHHPEHHLSRLGRRRRHGGAATGARLLLHNAKVGADGPHFHQIAAPLAIPQILVPTGIGVHGIGKVGVAVISVNVQDLPGQLMVVHAAKDAVGGDEIPRFAILAENLHLHLAEAQRAMGHKPNVIQLLVGIRPVTIGSAGHMDLLPIGVGLVPEHRAPGLVESVQGAVFGAKELPEGHIVAF